MQSKGISEQVYYMPCGMFRLTQMDYISSCWLLSTLGIH